MNELCVPLSSLSVSGEDESVPPAEGDMVDFSVAGKVSRVEGDKAYVTVEKANGQDLGSPKQEEAEESEESEIINMKKAAKAEDDEMGY